VTRALLLVVLLGWSLLAGAAERVLEFHSDVEIQADGALAVRERIKVQAEGRVIKRGIFRDFPTDYRDRTGALVRVPFEVTEVLRDGRPEPYVLQAQRNGMRVRIGDASVFLKRGVYTYEIAYRTGRQLGFFDAHDELYWNVNGTGWAFPMDRVSAEVRLPRAVPAGELKVEAYTGRQGARGRDFGAEAFDGGARFATRRMLGPHEGLTIVVMFPKGIVHEPTWRERAAWWLADNRGAAAGFAGLVLLLAFLYWRWTLVGRDPRAGPRFPRYEPPPGLGPAGVRYVDRMGADDRGFAAALLGLAQRGYLHIRHHDRGDSYEIERRSREIDWLPGEADLVRRLLPGGSDSIAIGAKHDRTVQAARDGLNDALKSAFGARYFSRNRGSLALGILLAIASFVAMILFDAPILFIAAVTVPMVVLLVLFSRWLPAYSVQGRKIQDAIDGLRQYLSVAEADDLRRMKAPPQTAEEFARLLPYALALEVEKTWADRFTRMLGTAAVAAAVSSYYEGDALGAGGFSAGRLSNSLGELGSTISAASTPPGSSSGGGSGGGGGGGSSGGGGGGGGGGGW
jgi:uncharacterized membrane protein YgcG